MGNRGRSVKAWQRENPSGRRVTVTQAWLSTPPWQFTHSGLGATSRVPAWQVTVPAAGPKLSPTGQGLLGLGGHCWQLGHGLL